jgi:hypothetical protein
MRETGHGEAVRAAVGALNAGDAAGYLRAFTPTSLLFHQLGVVPGVSEGP